MKEGNINGNGIPCVFTRFSAAGRLELASAANNDRFAKARGRFSMRSGARARPASRFGSTSRSSTFLKTN